MNTITIQLHEDDRRALDILGGKLDALIQEAKVISDTMELIRQALTNGAIPAAAPADPEADFAPEEEAPAAPQEAKDEPSVPWVTMADIQKKVVDLTTAGKKPAVKKLLQKYAPKVTAIPEDKFAEVLEKLTALEG